MDVLEGREPWWRPALAQAAANPDTQGLPILPLPFLVLSKLLAGRVQDIADVTRMVGWADDSSLEAVRGVIAENRPDLLEDLESLITLGKMEANGETDESNTTR